MKLLKGARRMFELEEENLCFINEYKRIVLMLSNIAPCIVFGSFGLLLTHPSVLEDFPHDVDIVVPDEKQTVLKLAHCLQAQGYTVFSWQDEITKDFDSGLLNGRYYIRAIRKENKRVYMADITYESDGTDFSALSQDTVSADGITVLGVRSYIDRLKARGNSKDKIYAQRLASLL